MLNTFLVVAVAHMKIRCIYWYDTKTLRNAYSEIFFKYIKLLLEVTIHVILNYVDIGLNLKSHSSHA